MTEKPRLSPAQHGLGDMDPDEFHREALRVVDQVTGYLKRLESYPVLPDIRPGDVRSRIPAAAPAGPEPMETILGDYASLIEPNVTHWQHPGFMGYFPSTASGPGILGEWLSAGLNSNVMFWQNAPASTELEERVVAWLRGMLGLPDVFDGMLTDTASVSSLLSLVAARHALPELNSRDEGLSGQPRLRIYASTQAHMSIEKAAIVTGIGRNGLRRIPVDDEFRLRPDALETAITEDRANGWLPFCVVGMVGTTSSTSVDPVAVMAEICEREKLWLHVDAAYAGAAALVPELRPIFDGWERADSLVFNPHKWMFTPFDASLLLFRKPDVFRDAFSIVPEYLKGSEVQGAHNFSEYGVQLGRRFRALKLWMLIRYFGADGIAARIREHCRMAQEFVSWVEQDADWELMAPAPFATVCFRFRPSDVDGDDPRLDEWNQRLLEEVNRSGKIYLSHTRLRERLTLRVSLGNPRAGRGHVAFCWALLRRLSERIRPEGPTS